MKTTAEKIAVMQGFLEGKKIELRSRATKAEWSQYKGFFGEPAWDWLSYDFRIKPEPRSIHLIEAHGVLSHEAYMVAPPCDARDIAAGYRVVEFVEVLK